jgi:hypothetical protein
MTKKRYLFINLSIDAESLLIITMEKVSLCWTKYYKNIKTMEN